MRLNVDQAEFIKQAIKGYLPDATVYLFGSRADNHLKGGDIDILVTAGKELTGQEKREIKIEFYKAFGQQKIDIVSCREDDPSSFKELVLLEAKKL